MNNKKGFIGGIAIGILSTIMVALGIFVVPTVLGKEPTTTHKLQYIQKLLEKNYVGELNQQQLEEGIYKGYVASVGDPYTNYFTKEEFAQFREKTSGTYAGIGVVMQVDQADRLITAVQVFENSPAEKAGMLPKDRIIKAEGVELGAENFDEAPKIIKGPAGTTVHVTIFRPSENKTIDLEIVRETVIYPTVDHRMVEDEIGYIQIKEFDEVTYTQFMTALEALKTENPKGIIIDVRNNLGGLLNIVAQITDELLPQGMIVYTKDKEGNIQKLESRPGQLEIPVTLLINENSASASEILAGALKDRNRAKLVGKTTYGKGVVQTILPIPDGSGIKVTTSKYYTPNDICIDGIGIEPDYEVELPMELMLKPKLEDKEDVQLQKAIEVIRKEFK